MAEDGAPATGKNSGHPLAFLPQARVAHGEDPAVNAMQAPSAHTGEPALPSDTRPLELLERDHAVLPRCDPRNNSVRATLGDFCIHGYA